MASKSIIPRQPRAVAWTSTAITQWQREQVAASGGDPSIVPDESFKFLRLPEVEERTGLSRTTIYRKMGEGTFPANITLGAGSPAPAADAEGNARAAA